MLGQIRRNGNRENKSHKEKKIKKIGLSLVSLQWVKTATCR